MHEKFLDTSKEWGCWIHDTDTGFVTSNFFSKDRKVAQEKAKRNMEENNEVIADIKKAEIITVL